MVTAELLAERVVSGLRCPTCDLQLPALSDDQRKEIADVLGEWCRKSLAHAVKAERAEVERLREELLHSEENRDRLRLELLRLRSLMRED